MIVRSRIHEVLDRGALLQKFRVGDHVEIHVDASLLQRILDLGANPIRCTDRHGRLVHDDPVLIHVLTDRTGDRQHMPQIRGAVLKRRGADGHELKQAEIDSTGNIRCELQAARLQAAFEQALKARFVDWQFTASKPADPVAVDVDAKCLVAGVRKTRGRNQSHITGTVDGDTHGHPLGRLLEQTARV